MTYNTGNALGSNDVRDLSDNAVNLDFYANGPAASYPDRFGTPRKSVAGMNAEFLASEVSRANAFTASQNAKQAVFDASQADHAYQFNELLKHSAYEVPVDYVAGLGIVRPTQTVRFGGELYRGKDANLPFTTTTWAADSAKFFAIGDAALRQELFAPGGSAMVSFIQAGAGAVQRSTQSKDRESVSLADFVGADPTGVNLCDTAGANAEAVSSRIYVPAGTWRFSTPMVHAYTTRFFGPGLLKYDNAEWWRKGGSSGSVSAPENYTLLYDFASQSDVSILFDGVAQPLTWISARTVQAPGSLTTTAVRINIQNGRLQLAGTPESPRSFNLFAGSGGSKVVPSLPDPLTNPTGMNNASYGPRNLMDLTSGGNNTSGGSRALMSLSTAENNTAFGFQTLYRTNGAGNTAVGSIAGEHLTTGGNNTLMGLGAGGGIVTGANNVAIGCEALNESNVTNLAVAVGYRALGNNGGSDTSQCVAVGAFSQDFGGGLSNTSVGYRALNGDGGILSGSDNTAQGAFAGRHLTSASFSTVFGSLALLAETSVSELFAMGFQSLTLNKGGVRNTGAGTYTLSTNVSGSDNTAVGWSGQKLVIGSGNTSVGSRTQEAATAGSNNSTLGFEAGRNVTIGSANTLIGTRAGREVGANNDNVALGSDSLQFLTSGPSNSALGRAALRLMQDTTNAVTLTNCTGVGANSRVSGNNQVQIGDSATTTYVYGTVQNRSDANDKTDVRDTSLGLEFIMGLRPVEGRWDMREDYFEEVEVVDEHGDIQVERRPIPKDGSKARERFHQWFLAQEVKALCDSLGVDFGGYQDHSVHGGCDVLSLGYDEFIPPVIKALQDVKLSMDQRFTDMEARIAALEASASN